MWNSFCQHLRECGRNAFLFMLALPVAVWGMAVVAKTMDAIADHPVYVLTGYFVAALLFFGAVIQTFTQKPARLGKLPPLSDLDCRTARTKLRPGQSARPAPLASTRTAALKARPLR